MVVLASSEKERVPTNRTPTMKNLRPTRCAPLLVFLAGLVLLTVLAGCDTVERYSIQSYQGPAPMPDQRYVEEFRQKN